VKKVGMKLSIKYKMVDMIEASYEDRLILVQFSFYH